MKFRKFGKALLMSAQSQRTNRLFNVLPGMKFDKVQVQQAGLPRPTLQHPIEYAPGAWHKVDFAWPDRRLAVEIDGGAVHTTRTAARRDRHLDRQIRAIGWGLERFMEDDVVDTPEVVLAALRALVESATPHCRPTPALPSRDD